MVDHQDAIEHSHTEESDEAHSSRYAERKTAQPEGDDASDERQWDGGEHHERIGDAAEC